MQTLPLPLLDKIGELSASRFPVNISFDIYDEDDNNEKQNQYIGQEHVMVDAHMNFDFNNEELEEWFAYHVDGMRPPTFTLDNNARITDIETDESVDFWITRDHPIPNPNDMFNPRLGWTIRLFCFIQKPNDNHIFGERSWESIQREFRLQLSTEVAPTIMRHLFAPSTSPFNEEDDDPYYIYKVVNDNVFSYPFFRNLYTLAITYQYDFNFELQNNVKEKLTAIEDDETFVVPYRLKM